MTRPRSLFAGGPNAVSEKDRPKCIREMDGDFRAVMMKAARTGLERPPATSISTVACTKRPLFVARPSPESRGGGTNKIFNKHRYADADDDEADY